MFKKKKCTEVILEVITKTSTYHAVVDIKEGEHLNQYFAPFTNWLHNGKSPYFALIGESKILGLQRDDIISYKIYFEGHRGD